MRALRYSAVDTEARWFEWRHNVQTRADASEANRDWTPGFPYLPIRPNTARRVLQSLPISHPSDYTFIDLGSGKGRMLLIASELPFRRIVGVEMRPDLHAQAMENLLHVRRIRARCSRVEPLLVDATCYDFPTEKIVVYLFNPFGGKVMSTVLERLDASFEQHPREIVLVYVYPESGFLIKRMRHFHILSETSRCWTARTRLDQALAGS